MRRKLAPVAVTCALIGGLVTAAGGRAVATGPIIGDFDGDGYGDLVIGMAGDDLRGVDAGAVAMISGDPTRVNLAKSFVVRQPVVRGAASSTGAQFGRAVAFGDINGDGRADLVVGAPGERVGPAVAAGGINVLFGTTAGLTAAPSQHVTQGNGTEGLAETGDLFGAAIAVGDVDGDGWADVVVGAPGEDAGAIVDSGVVHLLRGSASGLSATGDQVFSQAGPVPGNVEADDRFGSAVALADFDGDGHLDLAVGAPGEDVGAEVDAGTVVVFYGTAAGLRVQRAISITQGARLSGAPEVGDRFGSTVAVGDFDGDGYDDLAMGAPGETVEGQQSAGSVHVVYGSPSGLSSARHQAFVEPAGMQAGGPAAGDSFAAALAADDFDADGRSDLSVGVPGHDVGGSSDAGAVVVYRGTPDGLGLSAPLMLTQDGSGGATAEPDDRFGAWLSTGDSNADGYPELVVAAPGEDLGSVIDAGVVSVFAGGRDGLRGDAEVVGEFGIRGAAAEAFDGFGSGGVTPPWLDRLNVHRRQAGLDPVTESPVLSASAGRHADYMVHNEVVTHAEERGKARYSAEGDRSGRNSNVYGTVAAATPDVDAIDGWMTGPFHAVGLLAPSLRVVGYGASRSANGKVQMAASLDVWSAPRVSTTTTRPSLWPGDGSVVALNRHVAEYPSPASECPGHSGLPILAFFPAGVGEGSASLTFEGAPVDVCVFDADTYRNSDATAERLGRRALFAAHAVVVMARSPLEPGGRYCVDVSSGDAVVHSCFRVDPNA